VTIETDSPDLSGRTPTGDAAASTSEPNPGPRRRSVVTLGAAATLAAGGAVSLAACGSGSSGSGTAPASSAAPAASSSAGGAADSGGGLAKLADVPVGGAAAATGPDGKPIVIAQPTAGQVVAFSAICTHQGCKVAPAGKQLKCPCHGSVFDAFTGKNVSGPAPSPLAAVPVKVSGTEVVAG
jgi:Rieske Fe-S protein